MVLSALVIIPFLGETIFYSKGEPREAIVAYTMLESGNWVLPLNYGTDIAYKPPFLYWCIAAFSTLLGGVTEFASRLPSAVFFLAMLCVFSVFCRAERYAGCFSGVCAALVFFRGAPRGGGMPCRHGAGVADRDVALAALSLG